MVVTVRVAVAAVLPLMLTEVVTLQVAGFVAPEGPVTAQVSATVPVKPFEGVAVTADVLPVLAPAAIVILPPFESAKLGTGAVTVIESIPDALL